MYTITDNNLTITGINTQTGREFNKYYIIKATDKMDEIHAYLALQTKEYIMLGAKTLCEIGAIEDVRARQEELLGSISESTVI